MSDIINPILQWLNAHPELSGLATFFISGAESVAVIGTIVPGSVTMTAVGTLAGAGVIPLFPTIFFAIIGAVAGDCTSYFLGRYFKKSIPNVWPFRNNPDWLDKGERFIHKHGGKSIFIGRFVGPLRAIIPVVAGMLGMKTIRFLVASIIASTLWAPIYMFPGLLLGAASLELPPDIAVHVVLMLLMIAMFYIFCIWVIYRIFVLIGDQINHALTSIWNRLHKSRTGNMITYLLRHHNIQKTHGQLVLFFYLVLVTSLFIWLAVDILHHGPQSIFLNNAVYYLSHSLHNPIADKIMLAITLLGERNIVVPLFALMTIWLLLNRKYYAAYHVLGLGLLAIGCSEFVKHIVHSPRPVGLLVSQEGFSFPSGHTTLSTTFYVGMALLFSTAFPKSRGRLLLCGITIAFLVGVSRLYLEAHWLTDVVGGWLLGTAILILITISFNRKKVEAPNGFSLILFFFISLFAVYSLFYFKKFQELQHDYTLIDYPYYDTTENNWWQQSDPHLPHFRANRLGMPNQVLNLQWVGNLETIKNELLTQGWEIPPDRNWISIVLRLADVESTQQLPLMSPLYLDQKPVLVLIKHNPENKNFIVLRLWNSHVRFKNTRDILWLGTIEITPRTYNWLLGKRNDLIVTKDLLFSHPEPIFTAKEIFITTLHKKTKQPIQQTILLVKPE